jgi:hypothetical protein
MQSGYIRVSKSDGSQILDLQRDAIMLRLDDRQDPPGTKDGGYDPRRASATR